MSYTYLCSAPSCLTPQAGGTTCPSTQPCSFSGNLSDSLRPPEAGSTMHWWIRYCFFLITPSGSHILVLQDNPCHKITHVQSSAQKATTGYLSFPSAVEQSQTVWERCVGNWTAHLIYHSQKKDITKMAFQFAPPSLRTSHLESCRSISQMLLHSSEASCQILSINYCSFIRVVCSQ